MKTFSEFNESSNVSRSHNTDRASIKAAKRTLAMTDKEARLRGTDKTKAQETINNTTKRQPY